MAGTSEAAMAYWEGPGAGKTFTHPVPLDLLARWVDPAARILDFGCGYGRVLRALADAGYRNTVGTDPSAALVERGRRESPDLELRHAPSLPLAEPDGAFDAVLLVSVLTVIPDERDQRAVADEVQRLCAPGGVVVLCDFPLQDSPHHRATYAASAHPVHGVFTRPDGGVFRHHDPAHLAALFRRCTLEHAEPADMTSLNGHAMRGLQWVLRRG
ncbi:SAM-dependent methyltransferase [Streptomonospora nanhaiensis]|uniref:SAM-dependent methyltransferase n=1 Tax=Streptomonospora nanhaiensis TaxID=1323731 RepID=A0A853BPB6_9ACTN|nr:class I SAM-dependent methyltransferase [Streptomonospora nanhaiensis]NYI96496.1 SAM-dependent methyltransferase [Streptomonospora nanhaiensis]